MAPDKRIMVAKTLCNLPMIDTTSPTLLHRHAAVHLLKIELMQFEGPIGSRRADFDLAKLLRKWYRQHLPSHM